MDLSSLVAELKAERDRINRAVAALEGRGALAGRRGRSPKASYAGSKRRHMSAAARARIGAAKKAWWAKQKGKSAPKPAKGAPKKNVSRRPISAAAKRKLSALMKARWAAKKKSE
jgi:DNA-binding transcriptional MocR family regulator